MRDPLMRRGTSLIDVVVGTALMLVVFVGISGAFRLAIDAVSNNKARAGAIALANERLEYVRSLSYASVGTVGGIPAGLIPQIEGVSINDVTYTRRTTILFEDDPADGLGPADENDIITDYKIVKTEVSWTTRQGQRRVTMTTRVSPPTIETAVEGGTLSIDVVDATIAPVNNAQVRIVNASTSPSVDLTLYTDAGGNVSVIGTPPGSGYSIVVSKEGYSTSRTYDVSLANPNPIPGHLGVSLDTTTAATFAIDLLADIHVRTYEPIEEFDWDDSFSDSSRILTSSGIEVAGGVAKLRAVEGEYPATGNLTSHPITSAYLAAWGEATWDDETPSGTDIIYRIYDSAGSALIPDDQLPGNSAGFTTPPISLSGISTSTHPGLSIGAELVTTDVSVTPQLDTWSLTYESGPTPLSDVPFTLRGAKTIGSGGSGLIYKYDASHQTDASGALSLPDMEFDTYRIAVDVAAGLDIASSCPAQPVVVPSDSSVTTSLFLVPHTDHSLLVDIRTGAGAPVIGASVRLRRGAYDVTLVSDGCGHGHFPSLSPGAPGTGNAYTLDVAATGYQPFSSTEVSVSGTSMLSVILNQ